MPTLALPHGNLYYQLNGQPDAPTLVLSNSLGTDLGMWDAQIPALAEHFSVLRYDTRGHGRSLVSNGPYSIEQHAGDVLVLLDALGVQRASFCGLSMGGLIGQWLLMHAAHRLNRVVLCNTAAKIANAEIWNTRIETVMRDGKAAMLGLREASIARWFSPGFAATQPEEVERILDMLVNTSPIGYAANCSAVRDADYRKDMSSVRVPTLIVCGDHDPVTTVADSQFLADAIQGSKLLSLPTAHLSNVEAQATFTAAILPFLLQS
ncbi:3-oxoadipate enol-lactonase [Pseudomonas syringae group genomosp. 3]|nr:3-oxoadipate enol-lactonase [Pseudomonas syringae group genomosp. 3]RMR06165.1 Alpha/beta hydrolase fold protein [Pseudomonas syringae pv. primulae]RMU41796.1 Alpha/beta hydrolase fold protein [Pseudomonas syringae pv. primulae]